MKTFKQMIWILGLSCMFALLTLWIKGKPVRSHQCVPELLKADEICLDQALSAGAWVWVDARPRVDWVKSGVPGSILWNLDPTEDEKAFEAEAAMRILITPNVIVYCGDESCGVSRQVADRIRALGLGAKVLVLQGGWRALDQAGRVGPRS